MKKTLKDLTKDDWNTLFPITLEDHNPLWIERFTQEKELLLSKIGSSKLLRIAHFGSSSIASIKSKPYIDMLIEIPEELLFDENLVQEFADLGYTHFVVPERDAYAAYSSFAKGYHLDGKKSQIFHIHMCPKTNNMWQQIKFRDYLISNTSRAKAYEALKLNLAAQYKNDRGAYVLGKTNFIKETLALLPKT